MRALGLGPSRNLVRMLMGCAQGRKAVRDIEDGC